MSKFRDTTHLKWKLKKMTDSMIPLWHKGHDGEQLYWHGDMMRKDDVPLYPEYGMLLDIGRFFLDIETNVLSPINKKDPSRDEPEKDL